MCNDGGRPIRSDEPSFMTQVERVDGLSAEDAPIVIEGLMRFNSSVVPFTQSDPFLRMQYGIRDESGALIAGVLATIYCWRILHTDVLWVDEKNRRRGLGTKLLNSLEEEAKKRECRLAHLDTFDFQGNKTFYENRGYKLFGTLDECPPGHKRYFLSKLL